MKTIERLVMVAMLGMGGVAVGQGAPVTGTAGANFRPTRGLSAGDPMTPNTEFGVDVSINLTNVTGTGCAGTPVNAVLGGFQIAMEFDTSRLQLINDPDPNGTGTNVTDSILGQNSCTALRPAQYSLPTSTATQTANSQGTAVFVGNNGGSETAPTLGPRCYFRILFKTRPALIGTVNTTIRFRDLPVGPSGSPAAYKLSTAVQNCGNGTTVGPVDIPKNNDVTITFLTTPVELTGFRAE